MPRSKRRTLSGKGLLPQWATSYIDRNYKSMSAEMMAENLGNRDRAGVIQEYINTHFGGDRKVKREMKLSEELETRPEWDNFRQQFTLRELEHFKYRYVQLMGQFRDDVMPTEEMQLFQVITVDILIQRTMREHKAVMQDMEWAAKEIDTLKEDEGKGAEIKALESRYARGSTQLKDLSSRYESYLMRQSSMMKELKATRDQRVHVKEGSRTSFLGMLRLLNEDEAALLEMGREAELNRMAAEKEKQRLSKLHKYADGVPDRPLLTPETVELDDAEA